MRSLLGVRLLVGAIYPGAWISLTPAGCSTLATLVAAEVIIIPAGCVRLHGDSEDCGALCWTRSRCRVGMRGLEGGPSPTVIREALAWAPEDATGEAQANGGAAMADAP